MLRWLHKTTSLTPSKIRNKCHHVGGTLLRDSQQPVGPF